MQVFHSLWTLSLFVLFIAIFIWAWNGKRKDEFAEAEQLPFNDENDHQEPR